MTSPIDDLDALAWHRYAVRLVTANALDGTITRQEALGIAELDRESVLLLLTALTSLGSALLNRLAAETGQSPQQLLNVD